MMVTMAKRWWRLWRDASEVSLVVNGGGGTSASRRSALLAEVVLP